MPLFGESSSKKDERIEQLHKKVLDLRDDVQTLKQEKRDLKAEHKRELKNKQQEINHYESDKIQELKDDKHRMEKKIAKLETENEKLNDVIDLEVDIIDVKDLVNKLIEKLPQVDISNMNVNSNDSN